MNTNAIEHIQRLTKIEMRWKKEAQFALHLVLTS